MKFLLDTNVLLWHIGGDARLPESIKETIDDPNSLLTISIASIWEIGIKYSLNRLDLKPDLDGFLEKYILNRDIMILPIDIKHVLFVSKMPFHHRDPFDRLIFAQSKVEELQLLYTDPIFDMYL
jgi:PIN domain nuclease of toxin-antitoxin system